MKIKIAGVGISIDWLIKLLMDQIAPIVVDRVVKGGELSKDQKKLTRTLYYLADEYGEGYVQSTDTELDDEGLQVIMNACVDTADEGGFGLPDTPEDLD